MQILKVGPRQPERIVQFDRLDPYWKNGFWRGAIQAHVGDIPFDFIGRQMGFMGAGEDSGNGFVRTVTMCGRGIQHPGDLFNNGDQRIYWPETTRPEFDITDEITVMWLGWADEHRTDQANNGSVAYYMNKSSYGGSDKAWRLRQLGGSNDRLEWQTSDDGNSAGSANQVEIDWGTEAEINAHNVYNGYPVIFHATRTMDHMLHLYIQGELAGSQNAEGTSIYNSTQPIAIGGSSDRGSSTEVDHLDATTLASATWSRALSADEIAEHVSAGVFAPFLHRLPIFSKPSAAGGPTEVALAGNQPASTGTLTVKQFVSLAGSQPASTGDITAKQFVTLAGDLPAASGALSKKVFVTLTGSQPASTGAVTAQSGAFLAGDQPASTGALSNTFPFTQVSLTGNQPASTGALTVQTSGSQTVLGNQPASTGALSAQQTLARSLAGSQPAMSGALIVKQFIVLAGSQPAMSGALVAADIGEMSRPVILAGQYGPTVSLSGRHDPTVTLNGSV